MTHTILLIIGVSILYDAEADQPNGLRSNLAIEQGFAVRRMWMHFHSL